MTDDTKNLEKRLARVEGQLTVSLVSLNAIIRHLSNSQSVASEIEEGCEELIAKSLNRPYPDDFIAAIESYKNLVLGKK